MYIKNKTKSPGARVRLLKDAKTMGGTFTAGHEFTITDIGEFATRTTQVLNLVDDEGRHLNDVPFSWVDLV